MLAEYDAAVLVSRTHLQVLDYLKGVTGPASLVAVAERAIGNSGSHYEKARLALVDLEQLGLVEPGPTMLRRATTRWEYDRHNRTWLATAKGRASSQFYCHGEVALAVPCDDGEYRCICHDHIIRCIVRW